MADETTPVQPHRVADLPPVKAVTTTTPTPEEEAPAESTEAAEIPARPSHEEESI